MHTVLLTRPEPAAAYDADLWQQAGFEVVLAPLLTVNFIPAQLPDLKNYQAVVATSAQAILALARLTKERTLPLWCVGHSSAKVAAECGFQKIFTPFNEQENALGLAKTITYHHKGRLLYVSGEHVQFDMVEFLTSKGFHVDQAVLYKAQPNKDVRNVMDNFFESTHKRGVTFYSQRTALIFKEYADSKYNFMVGKGCWPLTFSPEIARHIQNFFYEPAIITSTTSQLIASLKRNVF